jgi:hypothetical protein
MITLPLVNVYVSINESMHTPLAIHLANAACGKQLYDGSLLTTHQSLHIRVGLACHDMRESCVRFLIFFLEFSITFWTMVL